VDKLFSIFLQSQSTYYGGYFVSPISAALGISQQLFLARSLYSVTTVFTLPLPVMFPHYSVGYHNGYF